MENSASKLRYAVVCEHDRGRGIPTITTVISRASTRRIARRAQEGHCVQFFSGCLPLHPFSSAQPHQAEWKVRGYERRGFRYVMYCRDLDMTKSIGDKVYFVASENSSRKAREFNGLEGEIVGMHKRAGDIRPYYDLKFSVGALTDVATVSATEVFDYPMADSAWFDNEDMIKGHVARVHVNGFNQPAAEFSGATQRLALEPVRAYLEKLVAERAKEPKIDFFVKRNITYVNLAF